MPPPDEAQNPRGYKSRLLSLSHDPEEVLFPDKEVQGSGNWPGEDSAEHWDAGSVPSTLRLHQAPGSGWERVWVPALTHHFLPPMSCCCTV